MAPDSLPRKSTHPDAPSAVSPVRGAPDSAEHRRSIRLDPTPPGSRPAPAYYDVPMLKPSLWKWEVPVYVYLGGIAGSSYLLSRLAARLGGGKYQKLAHTGALAAAGAYAPCPLLLVLDLGDPTRFHHMLRVFKPSSPMSVGSWTLSAFGGVVMASALDALTHSRHPLLRGLVTLSDLPGLPLGLMMAGYTGVLISTTSTPIWTQNVWLGPLFTASAFKMAASTISLLLELQEAPPAEAEPLKPIQLVAKAVESAALAGYLITAGKLARPLTHGKHALPFWVGGVVLGVGVSSALEIAAGKKRRGLKIASAVLGLAGGFLLKWSIVSAGKASGSDPQAARDSSRRR